uniref:NADH-ubiquinone oxidoreductase chain 3 n=1 Tax=Eupristina koningsbergeri TaxID=318089 RepID=A0A8A3YGH6_9HYME|nr:NADH dehydrogenase subunit 3 [Eupristina koningsbergeri]
MKMIMMILFFMILTIIMMMVNYILSKKMYKEIEKSSTFECGFDPMSKNRMPFSMQFYLIASMFLIFDVEIALIIPFISDLSLFAYYASLTMMLIMIILLIGLLAEWYEGALTWFK